MEGSSLRVRLSSYDYRLLDKWTKRLRDTAFDLGLTIQGPIPLPTRRSLFTFQKSPHVNKPSMEQFEFCMHFRLLIFSNYPKGFEEKTILQFSLPSSLKLSCKKIK